MPVMKLLLSVTVWKSLIHLMDISTQLRHGFNETVTVKHAGVKFFLSIHKNAWVVLSIVFSFQYFLKE